MLASTILLAIGGALAFGDNPPAAEEAPAQPVAQTEPTRQELICRSRPQVGSRIARQRICKTREEWAIYRHDLEQSRRDINDRGARGCNGVTAC